MLLRTKTSELLTKIWKVWCVIRIAHVGISPQSWAQVLQCLGRVSLLPSVLRAYELSNNIRDRSISIRGHVVAKTFTDEKIALRRSVATMIKEAAVDQQFMGATGCDTLD